MFFLLIAYFVGCCFLAERGIKHPICICMHRRIYEEWYLREHCGSVSCVLAEKQAVKAKKSTKVLTWGQKVLSDVLSARCVHIIGYCFPAEQKFD